MSQPDELRSHADRWINCDAKAMLHAAADRIEELEAEIADERALADQLGEAAAELFGTGKITTSMWLDSGCWSAVAAWREARKS